MIQNVLKFHPRRYEGTDHQDAEAEMEPEATEEVEAEASPGADAETPAGSDGSSGGASRAASEDSETLRQAKKRKSKWKSLSQKKFYTSSSI